jgi:UPF0755 protein
MARRMKDILRESAGNDTLPMGLSLHEVLTLASIVESEAQMDDERPRIARVYLNRLRTGMRLQADPTVAYGIGKVPRSRLLLRHLQMRSPFNTYLIAGLPPGPICNPGRESIRAVFHPADIDGELYFVARGNGRHFFAATYPQHLENIRQAKALIAARDTGARAGLMAPTDSLARALAPTPPAVTP